MDINQKLLDLLTQEGINVIAEKSDISLGSFVFGELTLEESYKLSSILSDFFSNQIKTWETVRAERNKLLFQCDWTQLLDASITTEERLLWQNYRQELKDIPQNFTDPDLVVFPIPPSDLQGLS